MGRFDGILIVSDVDGTFLDRRGGLVARNLAAVSRFCAGGGMFTFATGRIHYNISSVVPDTGKIANVPGIMANGAYLYDFIAGRALAECFMEPSPTLEVMRMIARDYPDCGIRVSTASGFLTDSLDGIIGRDLVRYAMREVTVAPMNEWRAEDWYKVVLRGESARLDDLRGRIAAEWPGRFTLCKSSPEILELLRVGCTKASALDHLRAVCTREGRAPLVCAVGDYENDLELLGAADLAFCPTNAIASVRAVARLCPVSCDDGVIAELIDQIEAGVIPGSRN